MTQLFENAIPEQCGGIHRQPKALDKQLESGLEILSTNYGSLSKKRET